MANPSGLRVNSLVHDGWPHLLGPALGTGTGISAIHFNLEIFNVHGSILAFANYFYFDTIDSDISFGQETTLLSPIQKMVQCVVPAFANRKLEDAVIQHNLHPAACELVLHLPVFDRVQLPTDIAHASPKPSRGNLHWKRATFQNIEKQLD